MERVLKYGTKVGNHLQVSWKLVEASNVDASQMYNQTNKTLNYITTKPSNVYDNNRSHAVGMNKLFAELEIKTSTR